MRRWGSPRPTPGGHFPDPLAIFMDTREGGVSADLSSQPKGAGPAGVALGDPQGFHVPYPLAIIEGHQPGPAGVALGGHQGGHVSDPLAIIEAR